MTWGVEFTDEFERWWDSDLSEGEQEEIAAVVGLLERKGPQLPFPYSSGIAGTNSLFPWRTDCTTSILLNCVTKD